MRIGFLALGGLRVADSSLLEAGMRYPALADRARQIASLPSLGLLTLAGMTPSRFGPRLIEVPPNTEEFNLPTDCDVLAITALAATEKEVQGLLQSCRDSGVISVVGGLHATMKPEAFEGLADSVVLGEGEPVWPILLEDLEANKLEPRYDARLRGSFDLRKAPMPAFELLNTGVGRRFTVQTQRGCPWDCEFCAASMRLAPFQVKPVEKVIAELDRLRDLYGTDFVEFADDNTFANRGHAKQLLDALAETNVKFFAETDLSIADDPEMLHRLRSAGCREVLIGFESPDFIPLDGIERQANWKARRVDRALRAVEKIQSHGIAVCGCFVLGLDGAGPESFDRVREFVEKSGLFDVQLTYLTPFPGTPLYHRLTEEGRILVAEATERYTLFDINFQPDRLSLEELETSYRKLMARLYRGDAVAERRRKYFDHLRNRIRRKRKEAA